MNYLEVGKDFIKYFGYILASYYMILLVVSINTFNTIHNYKNIKQKPNPNIYITNISEIIISIICIISEVSGTIFTGILTDTHNAKWFNQLSYILIISIVLFNIQIYFYYKTNKFVKNIKSSSRK